MSIVGTSLSLSEVRRGVKELLSMYPGLKSEYRNGGIFIEYDDSRDAFYSKGGVRIDKIPEVFEDCEGEYGNGTISIENILEYDETVFGELIVSEDSYDCHSECRSYLVGMFVRIDFNLKDFVPTVTSKSWGSVRKLPEGVGKYINKLIDDGVLSYVSRLHMVGDAPVVSVSSKHNGTDDYGLTEVILSWAGSTLIKEVYIIGYDYVGSYIARKNSDGEFTITMF